MYIVYDGQLRLFALCLHVICYDFKGSGFIFKNVKL